MTDFASTLDGFVAKCQTICDVYIEKNFTNLPKPDISIDPKGQKFVRIVRSERGQGGSVHCFVAKDDGSNKKLGFYKAGDVFKADGWVGPARGVRGNIFDANNGIARMGPHGVNY